MGNLVQRSVKRAHTKEEIVHIHFAFWSDWCWGGVGEGGMRLLLVTRCLTKM